MARTLTPVDAHVIMQELVHQGTSQKTLAVVDTSSFVSAGEILLGTGVENTLNTLSLVIGRTFMAVRPYKAKASIIDAITTAYTNRIRKISYYSRDPKSSGDWNTNLNGANLGMGRDNGAQGTLDGGAGSATPSMWEQNAPVPLELNFAGSDVWEDSTTVYRQQLKVVFTNESEFIAFLEGVMTEKGSDIESQKEAFNRMTLVNYMAGLYDVDVALSGNGMSCNLTSEFNTFFGTSYTSAALRSTYLKEFLEFMVARIKADSDRLSHRSARYHYSPAKVINGTNYTLLRHTPKDKQKLALYSPLIRLSESMVLPEIFNDNYLKLTNYEGFDYWQSFQGDYDNDATINIEPAIPDIANDGDTQIKGSAVNLYVVGVLFDTDACAINYQLEDSLATPVEARKRFYNIWWSFAKNAINDFTENGILYYMAD